MIKNISPNQDNCIFQSTQVFVHGLAFSSYIRDIRVQPAPPVAVHKARVGWWHEAEREVLPSRPWTASRRSAVLKMKPQTSSLLGLVLPKIPHDSSCLPFWCPYLELTQCVLILCMCWANLTSVTKCMSGWGRQIFQHVSHVPSIFTQM